MKKENIINIDIEFWEDVKIANDIDVRVNDEKAEINITGENTATVSYKFDNDKINNSQISGDNNNSSYQSLEEKTLDIPTVILTTVCIIVIVFSIIVIIKRNKS